MPGKFPRSKSRDKRKKDQLVGRSEQEPRRPQGPVPVRLEQHHVDGRKNNRHLTLAVCPFCHRMLHKRAREAGADLSKPPATVLHRQETVLRMRGTLYVEHGQAMCLEANEIENLIAGLDKDCPNWRRLTEAK